MGVFDDNMWEIPKRWNDVFKKLAKNGEVKVKWKGKSTGGLLRRMRQLAKKRKDLKYIYDKHRHQGILKAKEKPKLEKNWLGEFLKF